MRFFGYFFALAGGQIVNLAGAALLVPIFLIHWSPAVYGEWLVLSSLANYLSTLDLGMNAAVSNRLLEAHVRQDKLEYTRCQHSALAFYLALALGATVIIGLATAFLPVAAWSGLKKTPESEAAWVVWLLALQVLWMMPLGLVCNIYRTLGDPAKTQWINNVRAVLLLLSTALALHFGGGMRQLALWQLAPLAGLAVYLHWDVRRRFPEFAPSLTGADWGVARELVRPSLLFAVIMLAMAITQQGSVLVVSSALGGAAVAVFVTSRTLTNMAMQVVNIIKNAVWPDLTILFAQEQWDRLRMTNRLLIMVSGTLCAAIASALWFEGPSVVAVWTRHKLHVDLLFFRLMLLYLVLQSTWMASSALTVAINRHQRLSISYFASSVIGIAVAASLMPALGLAAVPLGLIAGEALACYHFVLKDTCGVLGEPYLPFALRVWLGGLLVMTTSLGTGWLLHGLAVGPAPLRWVEVGLGTTATAAFFAWWGWLNTGERALIRHKIGVKASGVKFGRVFRQPA